VKTVAITDRETAPAVTLADHSLSVSSHGMLLTNATAAVDVVLNALLVQIASKHRGETVEALSRINRILRDPSYLIDDE
jgi:DNA-binding MurR/RpiR family transcriptional regulator